MIITPSGITARVNAYLKAIKLSGSGSYNAAAVEAGPLELTSGTIITNKPIELYGAMELSGKRTGTLIKRIGKGPAIVLNSAYGHQSCNLASIRNLMISTEDGPGIVVNTNPVGKHRVITIDDLLIEGVTFGCNGISIDIPPLDDGVYSVNLRDINITQVGKNGPDAGRAVRIPRCSDITIDGMDIINVLGVGDTPVFDVGGHGTIRALWCEPHSGSGVRFSGPGHFDLRGCWFEQHANGVPHVTLDGVSVTCDIMFFFHDQAKLVMRNSTLIAQFSVEFRNELSAIDADAASVIRAWNASKKRGGVVELLTA